MKSENFRLIAEVAKRRCLWDTNMSMSYRNQESPVQWGSVARILQEDITTCKKRFKGLRDSYRAEIRKIQQKRIETSHWTYFRSLEFMRNIFDPERLVPFPPEEFDLETEQEDFESTRLMDFVIDVDLDNDDSVDFEIIGDIFKREPSMTQDSGSDGGSLIKPADSSSSVAQRSDQDLSPTMLSPVPLMHASPFVPRPPPPSKRARRRKTSPSSDGPILNCHASKTLPKSADLKNDSDVNFLMSMVPHVKSLSPISTLKFRMEMARILVELRKEDQQMLTGTGPKPVGTGLPKLTPAPDSSFAAQLENSQNYLSNSIFQNCSPPSPKSYDYVDSCIIECDVKIENEPLL